MSNFQKASGSQLFVGIDVSQQTLDISMANQHHQIHNTKAEIENFIKTKMQDIGTIQLCVLESTGGYERKMLAGLHKAKLPVHRAHPSRAHAFAKACNHFAKTDKLDALLLQKYASFISETEQGDSALDSERQKLKDLRHLLRSIEQQLHGAQCRIRQYPDSCHSFIAKQIKLYQTQIKQVMQELETIINRCKGLEQQAKRMQTMIGVGKKSATLLLAELPELGRVNKKQIASLLGVAPKTNESGKKAYRSRIQGGRFHARKVMYMCALVASRYDSKMREVYQKMVANGKAKKIALVAIMRKMIVRLNAMLKYNMDFNPNFA